MKVNAIFSLTNLYRGKLYLTSKVCPCKQKTAKSGPVVFIDLAYPLLQLQNDLTIHNLFIFNAASVVTRGGCKTSQRKCMSS